VRNNKRRIGARIGVYVCHCGHNIAKTVDCSQVADGAAGLEDVVVARDVPYACSGPGQSSIKEDIAANHLDRSGGGGVFTATARTHLPPDAPGAGLNPYLLEMANIREHCSWVHMHEPREATAQGGGSDPHGRGRVRQLQPLTEERLPLTKRTLVIGGGVAGIQAALDLADNGYDVVMVEKKPSIGGTMAQLDKTFPTMDCSI